MFCLVAPAQEKYDRYYKMYADAMTKKNQGKLNEAKTILLNIKNLLKQGGIPKDNDLNHQIALCTTITFSDSQMLFEARGKQSQVITVRTNSETYTVKSESQWCKVSKKGNGIVVYCIDNTGPNPRSAKVFVTADFKTSSFSVSQQGGQLEFYLHPNELSFSNMGDKAEVSVVTNAPSWHMDSVPYWMEYEKMDSTLVLRCAQNNGTQPRETTVYVVAADEFFPLVVRQAQSDTLVAVDKEALEFPESASEDRLTLKGNVRLDNVQLSVSDPWIDVATSSEFIYVHVQQNESVISRHGWVSIGCGTKLCKVPVHQNAALLQAPVLVPEIDEDQESVNKDFITIKSWPSHLKVVMRDDYGTAKAQYTPFDVPVDFGHYFFTLGKEPKNLFANKKQEVYFKPGFRFAVFTWAPKAAIGMMSGFVGSGSWGAYGHFQANTPIVTSFDNGGNVLSGYNLTLGPVYCPQQFPYIGLYAGVGAGAYLGEPHYGIDYEAGVMGLYRHLTLTMGFHTSRVSSSVKNTSFTVGLGGYLKRYYDEELGYCSSDSRRWASLNYVFRPAEDGKGLMVGDIGSGLARAYVKAMYISSDSLEMKCLEGGAGIVFTPMSGIIDLCLGVSARANIVEKEEPFQGVGAELGAIINVWRFPITVMMHESDLFGDRRLFVDFGIGFHLGSFSKSKSSYQ